MAEPDVLTPENEQPVNGYQPGFRLEPVRTGRLPLEDYQDPTEDSEFAKEAHEILENFRFYGILLKKQENGGYKRIETIQRHNAKCIDEVRSQYGPGEYQLRLTDPEGKQKQIIFPVKESSPTQSEGQQTKPGLLQQEETLAGLRRELKEEIRADYQADLDRMQHRLQLKDDDLDEKSKKIRDLNEEIGELRRGLADDVKLESRPLQQRITELENERWDLKIQIQELKTDLKLAGQDEPLSLGERVLEILKDNPKIVQSIGPTLNNLMSQAMPQQQLQNAPQEPPSDPPSNENEQKTKPNQEEVNQIVQNFANNVINKAVEQIASENPNPSVVKRFLDSQLQSLQQRGLQAGSQLWVGIARGLIQVSDQNGLDPSKVAVVIEPILGKFKQAKMILRTVDAPTAADLLINGFGIQIPENEKQFLISTLKFFKEKL